MSSGPARDPWTAPPRTDLPFLRTRSRPRGAPVPPAPALAPTVAHPGHEGSPSLADYIAARSPGARPATSQTSGADSSLDLSAPAPAPARPAPPVAPASSPPVDTSLDLSTPAAGPGAPSGAPSAPTAPVPASGGAGGRQPRPVARARSGSQTILTARSPTVTLTRVQSGVGTLTLQAICSDAIGDLRLGCAYQLRSGHSSTIERVGGNRLGPRNSIRPVLVAQREEYERISVDLRQSPELERLLIFGFSASGAQLRWGGTFLVTTFGGARIEIPLERTPDGAVAVLVSAYNVHGEFVLRAEMEGVGGSIMEACRAYGYDRITWADDRTPVD